MLTRSGHAPDPDSMAHLKLAFTAIDWHDGHAERSQTGSGLGLGDIPMQSAKALQRCGRRQRREGYEQHGSHMCSQAEEETGVLQTFGQVR